MKGIKLQVDQVNNVVRQVKGLPLNGCHLIPGATPDSDVTLMVPDEFIDAVENADKATPFISVEMAKHYLSATDSAVMEAFEAQTKVSPELLAYRNALREIVKSGTPKAVHEVPNKPAM